jgi:hypothetical protein
MNNGQAAPDNRVCFVWNGRNPREDAQRLTQVIAEKAVAELFRVDGALMLLHEGKFVPVNPRTMKAIVAKHVRTIHWINTGPSNDPQWQIEFVQFEFPAGGNLNQGPGVLVGMIKDLTQMVARGPAKPIIAEAYRVEPDIIKEIAGPRRKPTGAIFRAGPTSAPTGRNSTGMPRQGRRKPVGAICDKPPP